jgi:uncharacterized membrane protein YeaQ/YmgE (transglycosylase-associated protein family)
MDHSPAPQAARAGRPPKESFARAILDHPDYRPGALLDHVAGLVGARTWQQLADILGTDGAQLSRTRRGLEAITPGLVVAILDVCPGLSIAELRRLAGMPSPRHS